MRWPGAMLLTGLLACMTGMGPPVTAATTTTTTTTTTVQNHSDVPPGWRIGSGLLRATIGTVRRLTAAGSPLDRRAPGDPVWSWPLTGQPPVLRRFDPPAQRWLAGHRGIDVGGIAGAPVRAVADGVVAFSGSIAGVGIVSVQHSDGLRSTYQPVDDRVGKGDRVSEGQSLGTLSGVGHCFVRTCLHLGAKHPEAYLDPLLLLESWEVSLLPLP